MMSEISLTATCRPVLGATALLPPSEIGRLNMAFKDAEQPFLDLRDRPSPDVLRVLAIGSPQVVNDCVMTLFRLGYARPEDWSRPLPTINPGEVMRILTKRVILAE